MNECRQCNNARRKKRYYENYEAERKRRKEYYVANRDEILAGEREYCKRNKELVKARGKSYRESHKAEIAARAKARREQDVEGFRASRREYYAKNKARIQERAKIYRAKYAEKRKESAKQYRLEHKDEINNKKTARLHSDPIFKLKEQSRNMLRCALRTNGHRKNSKSSDILGCSLDCFVEHLKNTWKLRYGAEWNGEPCHIDHIIPLSTASTEEETLKLCHYSNLQLLTPEDNMAKSNKIIG